MVISPQLLRIERWRTRLIDEGIEAIDAFMQQYPRADRKRLKALTQEAGALYRWGTPRKLLRYIRELDSAEYPHAEQADPAE